MASEDSGGCTAPQVAAPDRSISDYPAARHITPNAQIKFYSQQKMTDLFSSMYCLDKAELIQLWMKIKCGAMSYDCAELNKSCILYYVCIYIHTIMFWASGFGLVDITSGYVSIWHLIEIAEKMEYSFIVAWIP